MRHPVWVVAKRELKTRALTKSNIISMAVILALILVGTVVGHLFMGRDGEPPTARIGVAPAVADLIDHLRASGEQQAVQVDLQTMPAAQAETALTDSEIDAYLSGDPAAPEMLVAEHPDQRIQQLVAMAVQSYVLTDQVNELGGDPAAFAATLSGAAPQVRSLEITDETAYWTSYAVSIIAISLLLFALILTGSTIAMGVVEEKTSRVVELLLATIRPAQLMAGKILGIGIFGLFQIVVYGGALTAAAISLGLTVAVDVSIGVTLAWLVVWFLLGYAVFALLFGGFAALVSRQEEVGSVTTPLMFLLFVPYYLTVYLVATNPGTTLARVLSQVPMFAPFMMPVREAFDAVTTWELALSIGITLATIPLLIWVAARVYQRGILHTGGRMKLGEALRGAGSR